MQQLNPKKVLEIGSFEGAATCSLIESNTWTDELTIFCVDTWGGIEHKNRGINMKTVESDSITT